MVDEHRAQRHSALSAFLGEWHAEGTSYASKGTASPWKSIHIARWHSGEHFVIQDERASGPFSTMSFLGWDPERQTYFSWSVDNGGFPREYLLSVDGRTWTFAGASERATISFSGHGHVQTHHWEIRAQGEWLPLCDRVATRVE